MNGVGLFSLQRNSIVTEVHMSGTGIHMLLCTYIRTRQCFYRRSHFKVTVRIRVEWLRGRSIVKESIMSALICETVHKVIYLVAQRDSSPLLCCPFPLCFQFSFLSCNLRARSVVSITSKLFKTAGVPHHPLPPLQICIQLLRR